MTYSPRVWIDGNGYFLNIDDYESNDWIEVK